MGTDALVNRAAISKWFVLQVEVWNRCGFGYSMSMAIQLRPMAEEERAALERLAHSRTEPARLVERARIAWYASQGERAPQIAQRLELDPRTVRTWLNRF